MIHRVRGRSAFRQLRSDARRFHDGPLSLRWLPEPAAGPPRVAYAIGRGVGTAVTRNRLRRRLRGLLAREAGVGLPSGSYLIGVGAAAASEDVAAFRAHVRALCGRVRAAAAE